MHGTLMSAAVEAAEAAAAPPVARPAAAAPLAAPIPTAPHGSRMGGIIREWVEVITTEEKSTTLLRCVKICG